MNYNEPSINKKRKELKSEKNRIRTSASSITFRAVLIILCGLFVCGAGLLYGCVRGMLASAPKNYDLSPKYSATFIYDDDGNKVQKLSSYDSNRVNINSEDMTDDLKNAFIAIEDERFYEHEGIDIRGILRALWTDIRSGSTAQGASTITQQLVKNNVFNAGGETNLIAKITRKVQEQYLAIKAEENDTKDEILTDYLNSINLGKGTLGVEAASEYYFNKSAKDLTLSECAALAAITKNPTRLNPTDHPDENNERRKLVLEKMYSLNFINSEDYQKALNEDVYSQIKKNTANVTDSETIYSYFTDAVITQVVSDLQEKKGYTQSQAYQLVYKGGLRIYSTQDSELQSIADSVINDPDNYPVDTKYSLEYKLVITREDNSTDTYTESNLISWYRKVKKKKNYFTVYDTKKDMKKAVKKFRNAMLREGGKVKVETIHYSMEPQVSYSLINQKNGEVKVLVGGRGKKQDNLALNRATGVKRQPGSTFKILSTYAPALDTGGMTLATVFDDAPYTYENGDRVTNYVSTSYGGLTTIRDAIIDSNNIVAVKALTEITPQAGFNFLEKLGFTTLVNNRVNTDGAYESDVNQALSLGGLTDGVTNLELTAAYAAIANQGRYNKPVLYTKVTDSNGQVLLENKKSSQKVMKKSTAWLLTDAMEDVVEKGTGKDAKLDSDMPQAGKTGTTSNNYDYWFCGYTPYYTASIWTGYDYNTSFSNKDDYHKVIWKKIMDRVIEKKQQKTKNFPSCKRIKKVDICIKSGKKAIPGVCSKDREKSMVRTEYFAAGTEPKKSCDVHIAVTLCTKSHRVARKYCPKKFRTTIIYRLRPEDSTGETDDSKYWPTFNTQKDKCDIHTKAWKQARKEKRRKKKEQEEKKKQEEEKKKKKKNTSQHSLTRVSN